MDISQYQQQSNDFEQLSLKDLLDARDLYHIHLMKHPKVVATAIGRYRIRQADDWPSARGPGKPGKKGRRTLENSEIRPYSWPAVLVFVEEWLAATEFSPTAPMIRTRSCRRRCICRTAAACRSA